VVNAAGNIRNGTSRKTLKGDLDELSIEIPRDRHGSFEPHSSQASNQAIKQSSNQAIKQSSNQAIKQSSNQAKKAAPKVMEICATSHAALCHSGIETGYSGQT
jgi:hypothetical protein